MAIIRQPHGSRAMFANCSARWSKHKLRPQIDRVFPFSEVPKGFQHRLR